MQSFEDRFSNFANNYIKVSKLFLIFKKSNTVTRDSDALITSTTDERRTNDYRLVTEEEI